MSDADSTTSPLPFELAAEEVAGLPEGAKGFYEPVDGDDSKYRLRVDGAIPKTEAEKRIQALDKKNRELLGEFKTFKDQFGDVTPEDLKTWREEKAKAEREAAKAKGDWETREQQLRGTFEEKLTTAQQERERLRKRLEDRTFSSDFRSAVSKVLAKASNGKASAEDVETIVQILGPHARDRIRYEWDEEEGELAPVILGKGSRDPMYVDGSEAGIEDLVEELRRDELFGTVFATPRSGSGSTKNARRGYRGANPFTTGNLTDQARLKKENPAVYEQLKAEHLASEGAATQ